MTNKYNSKELLPCPFCSHWATLKQWPQFNKLYLGDISKSTYSVFCSNCFVSTHKDNKDIVLNIWNTRAKESEKLVAIDIEKSLNACDEEGWNNKQKSIYLCSKFGVPELPSENAIEKKIIDEIAFIEIPKAPTNGTDWFCVNGRYFTIKIRTMLKGGKK